MANVSKINTVTFEHDGNSVRLRASLANLDLLEADVGTSDLIFYMQSQVTNPKELARMFHHLQVVDEGEERASKDQMYDWFFCDYGVIMDDAWQKKLLMAIGGLFGSDLQKKLAELDAKQKKAPQKKEAASTSRK